MINITNLNSKVIRDNSRYNATETQKFTASGGHDKKKATHLNPRSSKQYDRNKKMLSSSNGICYSISTLKSAKTLKCHQQFWVSINDKILRSVLLLTPAQQSLFLQVILSEIDCAIFYTNLHELFCQFISWTNWVNYGQLLNIMSSYGWYEKSLQRSHNY